MFISCAPELLEALKDMISFVEFHGNTSSTEINNAKQLIKKQLNKTINTTDA